MPQLDRTGVIRFHDAKMSIMEEGLSGDHEKRTAWESRFKKDVFARIIQQLNRLGWAVQPNSYIFTGNNSRYARKGDLRLDLKLTGQCIDVEFFQNVHAPNRPDHAGRYESDKEILMPYILRIEMERTRRKLRRYLCNIFSGYSFSEELNDARRAKVGSNGLTALEYVNGAIRASWHFKEELGRADWGASGSSRKSADGQLLDHGQRVWFFDRKGRTCTGIAYYNLNNMWWVVTGKYGYDNKANFDLYAVEPENPRVKNNSRLRRKRPEEQLSKAVALMDFLRADVIKKLLWPEPVQLYVLWHKEHKAYHRCGYSGYTSSPNEAGKFTLDEAEGHNPHLNDIVPLEKAV